MAHTRDNLSPLPAGKNQFTDAVALGSWPGSRLGHATFIRPLTKLGAKALVTEVFGLADIKLDGGRPWDIQVHDERFFSRVLADGTLGFGETYVEGWWDCSWADEMFFRAIQAKLDERAPINFRSILAYGTALLLNLQDRRRSRAVGIHHYDLGNDFFESFPGESLQYSCAYFKDNDDLDVAQRQKRCRFLICRKPDLRPGMRLLDIGCGWGGLARHAARNFGCAVVGITISRQQQVYAANLFAAACPLKFGCRIIAK